MTNAVFLPLERHVQHLANNFLLKSSSMFCHYDKQLLSVVGLLLDELDANKKCRVSLVVKCINREYHAHVF